MFRAQGPICVPLTPINYVPYEHIKIIETPNVKHNAFWRAHEKDYFLNLLPWGTIHFDVFEVSIIYRYS